MGQFFGVEQAVAVHVELGEGRLVQAEVFAGQLLRCLALLVGLAVLLLKAARPVRRVDAPGTAAQNGALDTGGLAVHPVGELRLGNAKVPSRGLPAPGAISSGVIISSSLRSRLSSTAGAASQFFLRELAVAVGVQQFEEGVVDGGG